MRARLVRYGALEPCYNAFIDTRSPGSEAKENFTIIGPGVSENPAQHVHIREPHGFNVGGARQPPHCVNSQHSHDTAEVFVVHRGQWTFNFGEHGEDVRAPAGPGAVVSIPPGMFRGFTNVGDEVGFLWSVLGGDDPGRVTWAPYVFDMAKDYGLVLLEDGRLIDTVGGEALSVDARPMTPTSREQAARLRRVTASDVDGFRVSPDEFASMPTGPLSQIDGIDERALIGLANPDEEIGAGKLGWRHGFQMRRVSMAAKAATPMHTRAEAEVVFVHEGGVRVSWPEGEVNLGPGDTLTIPIGLPRRFVAHDHAVLFVVRGGDEPGAPVFVA